MNSLEWANQLRDDLIQSCEDFSGVLRNDSALKVTGIWRVLFKDEKNELDSAVQRARTPNNPIEKNNLAILALSQVYKLADQDGKETIRCPGAVSMSMETIEVARKLNKKKKEFCEYVDALTTEERKKVYRGVKGLVGNQLRRKIPICEHSFADVKVRWHSVPSIDPITAGELAELIELKYKAQLDRGYTDDYNDGLVSDLKHVRSLPSSERLAIARLGQPHLRLYVNPSDERGYYVTSGAPVIGLAFGRVIFDDYAECKIVLKEKFTRFEDKTVLSINNFNVYRYSGQYRTHGETAYTEKVAKMKQKLEEPR